jgi:UDP-N-acetylmuramoyl-tripeptide--D-alanyl-D-alanine ligase
MKLAIENFNGIPENEKVLVLGAMAELGESSVSEHEDIVELIKKYTWKEVILVGKEFEKIPHPFVQLPGAAEAAEYLKKKDYQQTFLLLKGSRSMQMEKVAEVL